VRGQVNGARNMRLKQAGRPVKTSLERMKPNFLLCFFLELIFPAPYSFQPDMASKTVGFMWQLLNPERRAFSKTVASID
jgi:hypothetical protein